MTRPATATLGRSCTSSAATRSACGSASDDPGDRRNAMRMLSLAALCLTPAFLAAPSLGAAQDTPSMADRLANDPRVEALRPYGFPLVPPVRSDKSVQFGKMLRIPLE